VVDSNQLKKIPDTLQALLKNQPAEKMALKMPLPEYLSQEAEVLLKCAMT
jgi:hypothetical protein